jgi:hypothetical protein
VSMLHAPLLGLRLPYASPDFVVISADDTSSGVAFQLAADHHPPQWPDPMSPQQMHLDVMVDDVSVATRAVIALGARPPGSRPTSHSASVGRSCRSRACSPASGRP